MNKQRGVALITVLLVFAVVAVIAAEMLRRSQLNLRSVSNLIETRQAYYYALGGEALARKLLALDVKNGHGSKDSLDEPWAKAGTQPPFEFDNGAIKIEINDLQGRFNLNSVVDAKGQPNAKLPQLKQLFTAVGVDARFADEWRDWVDVDQAALPAGAEDAAYAKYKTAGAPEADISALRLLKDMQPDDYDKIAPHVVALPPMAESDSAQPDATPSITAINVNTADSTVLGALGPIISAHLSQILTRQKQSGYATTDELQQALGAGADISELDVKSNFFEVITTVKYLDRVQRLRSVLQRDQTSGAITVLSRSRIPFTTADTTEENLDR